MKKVKLTDIAPYSGKRVQPFDGVKRYMSTGDLQGDNLSFDEVTYETKPSRADILVSEGDILFAKMTNTNKSLQIDKEHDGIIVSTGFSVHRPLKNKLSGEYFLHILKHDTFQRQKDKLCTGAIQSAISNSGIEKIFVPVPDYDIQLQIANQLSKAEYLIAERNKSIRLLGEFLKSKFLEMFGDPVVNEKKWKATPFLEVGKFKSGGTPSKERADFWNGDFPWVSPKDMKVSKIVDSQDHISSLVFEETALKRIASNHLLIVVRGMILAHSFPIAINGVDVAINQDMKAIQPNRDINLLFLLHCLNAMKRQILNLISTAGHGTRKFDASAMQKLFIPIPPFELQTQFAQIVEKTETLKTQYQQSLQELENLYGSLSQRAFKGELTANKAVSA
jgi:restriction endonuclease S subunit